MLHSIIRNIILKGALLEKLAEGYYDIGGIGYVDLQGILPEQNVINELLKRANFDAHTKKNLNGHELFQWVTEYKRMNEEDARVAVDYYAKKYPLPFLE